jgi:hypothetical protein
MKVLNIEDPVMKRKRERDERIQKERQEMANFLDPFSNLGNLH